MDWVFTPKLKAGDTYQKRGQKYCKEVLFVATLETMLILNPLLLTSVCFAMTVQFGRFASVYVHVCLHSCFIFVGAGVSQGCGQTQTGMQQGGQVHTHRNKNTNTCFFLKHTSRLHKSWRRIINDRDQNTTSGLICFQRPSSREAAGREVYS